MSDQSTVTGFLQDDHERLDGIVEDLRAQVSTAAFARARELFAELVSGLRRHIDVEEQVLFPALEAATGMKGYGPTVVMRREHVEIRSLLDRTAAALEKADAAAFADASDALTALLAEHNRKEEHILYPMADRVLAAGAAQVVETLRAGLGAHLAG